MDLPSFASIYRPGKSDNSAMVSDNREKLSIKGVKPEELDIAIQKLSKPKSNPVAVKNRISIGKR